MKEITPEEIYIYYHAESFYKEKGFYPKQVFDFSNAKKKEWWVYFEKFALMVNNNAGLINWKLYISALIDFYKGRFDAKLLCHPSSIKIYKTEVKIQQDSSDINIIEKKIMQTIKNVVEYMKENDIKEFSSYLNENSSLLPTIAKHFYSGTLSKYFLALVPNIILIIGSFPQDVVDEYLFDFKNEYEIIRAKVICVEKFRKISDNMDIIIEKLVNK